ncbi:fungal-specific transcription factor domain-containing protein [Annulohypoxylon maeteangense]|uniref:fungal-specific transcription factor domain-containing protein n=1 Tax=Annulohypoxylon maeteangense TaxID=1927788 RepID=UPI002007C2D4|nr:fungal-specific transcription factor domain-containing protein [Annulohypoxylon maeteangense]KAI0882874.1 fungal-specific transcription factor domain-containing protein [Annulohypoxylon maeteangense]
MDTGVITALARTSCQRCHKRKKKCDRTLPQCDNCRTANVNCSFLDADQQSGTYPIAFVQGLEARIQELERQLALALEAIRDRPGSSSDNGQSGTQSIGNSTQQAPVDEGLGSTFSPFSIHGQEMSSVEHVPAISMARELRILSLEATAERHLGSSSGLSFAKLTQTILKRLTPDRADFVFGISQGDDILGQINWDSPPDFFHPHMMNFPNISGFGPTLFGDMSLSSIIEPSGSLSDLGLPTKSRADQLASFYFAHSHTLYPIINQSEFLALLNRIYEQPLDLSTMDPMSLFRVWMVLAIGSSSRCSVSVVEESEALLYYNKALEYFEAAFDYGDMVRFRYSSRLQYEANVTKVALETIMLQVSFSFFNQLGPNTWFLVGTAARMAIGLGLHTSSAYEKVPFKVANMRKRIFFSIYMMDRVISIALGRPFALQDDDIEIDAFIDVDDDHTGDSSIQIEDKLEPSLMSIPRHILDLRRIASKISRQVYGNQATIRINTPHREEIIHSLHKELIDWRRNMPFPLPDVHPRVPHLCSNWYDFNYYLHTAMLYRPSPLFPTLDQAMVKKLANAASMSIRQAYTMHRQKRFAYNWLNLLSLFMSTISLIYASTVQPQELVSYLQKAQVIDDLELVLQLFDKLNGKFSGAKNIQCIIDRVLRRYKEMCNMNTPG